MATGHNPEKILFITPPYRCGVVDVIGRWIPLGLVYLAGAARLAGIDAGIYDARSKEHDYPEIEQRLRSANASYVATTAITSSINDALKILELAKRINPKVVTILGGIHPTLCYEEVLNATSAVDFVICGEGEATLRELLQSLEADGNPADISGLAFRRNDCIIKTSPRALSGNPDELPAAWDLLDWQDYEYFVLPASRLGAISTSRAGAERRRFRDPQNVAAEIVHLYETYGVNVLLVTDENAASDRERWETLLDLLMELNLPIKLLMQVSPADILRDRGIIWKYRSAGVIHIYVEIKAVDKAAPDSINCGLEATGGKLALDIIREHGIVSEASFVVGGAEETAANIERTMAFAQHCNPDNVQFLPLTPWPNDDAYDDVRQYIKVRDYAKYNLIDAIIEPKAMSLMQVDAAIMNCYRRFYMGKMMEVITMKDTFKRDYLLKAMKLMMVNPFILKKLGMGALGSVPVKIGKILGK